MKITQAKDWGAILSSSIIVKFINLSRGIYVAKFLGPETFGILSAIQMISQLQKYGSMGFNSVVGRDAPFYEGEGNYKKVDFIKSSSYSFDLILALILFIAGLASVFFIENSTYKIGIAIASCGLLLAKIAKMHTVEIHLEQKFIDNARIELIVTTIVTVCILLSVKYGGMLSVLFFTAFGSLLTIILYHKKVDYRFKFTFSKVELIRQVKIGFPLMLGTLAYGSYRYSEKILILTYLGAVELGFYALGTRIMDAILNIAITRIRVTKVNLSIMLGKQKYEDFNRKVVTETIISVLTILILSPIFMATVEFIVIRWLQNYIGAIPVLKVIVLASSVRLIGNYVIIAIQSPVVNMQKLFAPLQLTATLFLVSSTIILHKQGLLNLYNFVLLDISGYLIWHLSLVGVYYAKFYNKLVRPA